MKLTPQERLKRLDGTPAPHGEVWAMGVEPTTLILMVGDVALEFSMPEDFYQAVKRSYKEAKKIAENISG